MLVHVPPGVLFEMVGSLQVAPDPFGGVDVADDVVAALIASGGFQEVTEPPSPAACAGAGSVG